MNLTRNSSTVTAWEAVATLCPSLLFTSAVKVSPVAPAFCARPAATLAFPATPALRLGGKCRENFCVCGGRKTSGRLCSACLETAPDYIRENYRRGSPRQQQDAARWLRARGPPRRQERVVKFPALQNPAPIDLYEI